MSFYYHIFESSFNGYVINVYSSNQKDEDGLFLDINLIDGGLCSGTAKDAIVFMLQEEGYNDN